MFRTVPLSIIRSFSLYIQQWYMSYRFAESLWAGSGQMSWSCTQAVSKPVRHIPLLYVQWKTPDDGQRNCPKHVDFYSKNKFEKSVHLVCFITRIHCRYNSDQSSNFPWVWSSLNLRVPWNAGNFLTSCKPVSCSGRTLHHGVSK